jgi:hypothetical protein
LSYGALRHDLAIIISNSCVFIAVLTVIAVKLRSRRFTVGQVELVIPGGRDPLGALESLVEIGPQLASDLQTVGIEDLASLRATGAEEANRRLVEAGLQTGGHSREAIQGAIAGEWGAAHARRARSSRRRRAARRRRGSESSKLIGRSS